MVEGESLSHHEEERFIPGETSKKDKTRSKPKEEKTNEAQFEEHQETSKQQQFPAEALSQPESEESLIGTARKDDSPRNIEARERKQEVKQAEQLIEDLKAPDGRVYHPEDFQGKSPESQELVGKLLKVAQVLFELFLKLTGGDARYFNEGDFVPDGTPEDIDKSLPARDLASELRGKYSTLVLKNAPNINRYKDGDRLGTKQCARFVSEVLGLPRIIWSAQELFVRLCQPEKNGSASNLKTNFEDIEQGDVVFFTRTYDNGRTITHTGIVVSSKPLKMRHHSTFRSGIATVDLDTPYYRDHFYAAVTPVTERGIEDRV